MSTIDLRSFVTEFGPRFADAAALREETDTFVAENQDLLKERRIFSALVPAELGGGGSGFYRKLGLEWLLRDAHGVQFHALPEKRQQLLTGRLALGLDPVGGIRQRSLRRAAE